MEHNDFKSFVQKNVTLMYPRLDQTYRFNSAESRSEPCEPTAAGAAWSVSFTLSDEDAKAFYKALKAHYEECAKHKKLPEFKTVFGMKKGDDGVITWRAKRNGTTAAGKPNQPPMVVGRDPRVPLENKAIWGGSVGSVKMLAFPTKSPGGEGGITLLLDAVQVVEAKYGGSDLSDSFDTFAPDDGGDDPFSSVGASTAAAKPAVDDDVIPF